MKMALSRSEMNEHIWEMLDDFVKMHAENISSSGITESNFFNVTQTLSSSSFENYEQTENTSLPIDHSNNSFKDIAMPQSNLTTIYALYPSGILWFGAICCTFFAIFGTFGNFVSALALVSCKRLRNATTAFIVNLCVSDLLYCAFTMPLTAVTFIDRDWRNGDALCRAFALVKFTNGMLSIFTVVAITINRYVLICHPSIYKTVYSRRNTGISIACLWLFPLSLIFLPLFDVWGTLTYNPRVGDCGVNNLHGTSPRALIFVVIIVVPSVMFIACYLRIYFVVKNSIGSKPKQQYKFPECDVATGEIRNNAQTKIGRRVSRLQVDLRDKKEFRVLRIVLVIFIFYTASIFPISLIKLFRKEAELQVLNVLGYIFYFASSVVNPIVYIVMSREYRMAYKELFTPKSLGRTLGFSTSTGTGASSSV